MTTVVGEVEVLAILDVDGADVIQSLFPLINGQEPEPIEVDQYVQRLRELKDSGTMARIGVSRALTSSGKTVVRPSAAAMKPA